MSTSFRSAHLRFCDETHAEGAACNELLKGQNFILVRPTWRGLMPALVHVAAHGETAEARAEAMNELLKLADAVDAMTRNS